MYKKIIAALGLLVPLLACAAVLVVPSLRARAESLPRRVETWWIEQQPHDMFVPAPPEAAADGAASPEQLPTILPSLAALPPAATAEPTLTSQPTLQPGKTLPVLQSTPTNAPPAVAVAPAPPELKLTNFKHDYQGWNNCGPTTLGMLLSHFGLPDTQKEIAPVLKPNENDKNVSPNELAGYVLARTSLGATYRINGDIALVKRLLANGFPVIVETWFLPRPNDGMGHYRLLFGYSDAQGKFFALDSYHGPNEQLPYAEFDTDWKAFNRTYLVAYRPEQLSLFAAILGGALDDRTNVTQAREQAERDIAANGDDAFAWHNLGGALHLLGQDADAVKAFDRARKIGLPWRMLWYQFEMFDSYLAVGRYQDVLDLAAANLRQAGDLEESHYYRGRALQAMGKTGEAVTEYREALRFNKNYAAPAKALRELGITLELAPDSKRQDG
jgi:tetratricopeptide (TPR) repeat protein